MPAQRLEKWLKAAVDQAAEDGTLDVNLTDSRRALDLIGRGRPDETDLHPLYR